LKAFVGVGWVRGQPTTIILFLATLLLVLLCDRRPLAASLALSVAISIKMFPAAFLLIPFLRRDVRTLAYTLVLTALLLFAFPALCLGWQATVELYRAFWNERLQGLLSGEVNPRIAEELSPWNINVVSFGAILARLVSSPAPDAPFRLPAWATYVQYGFDLAVPLAIAIAGYGRFWRLTARRDAVLRYPVLLAGALLMAALPVARPHYWMLQIPLVAMLLAERWWRTGRPSSGQIVWAALALVAFVATGPDAPGILSVGVRRPSSCLCRSSQDWSRCGGHRSTTGGASKILLMSGRSMSRVRRAAVGVGAALSRTQQNPPRAWASS
jgi:hypothetical protein